MLVLAVDTATPAVTAGVVALDGDRTRSLATRVSVDARAHGELLMPNVRAALDAAGVAMGELGAIVCGVGPGPFTGLRAGMVTASALGHALRLPVYPVCSLDAIAAEAGGGRLLVVTDARRREVYWARYDGGLRSDGPHVERPSALAARELGFTAAAGHGAAMYAAELGVTELAPAYPGPLGLVTACGAAVRDGAEPGELTPLYLRRPDAAEPAARKRVSQG